MVSRPSSPRLHGIKGRYRVADDEGRDDIPGMRVGFFASIDHVTDGSGAG